MKAPRTARALNIMAILLAGFLLATHHPAFAQGLGEADALDVQVAQLFRQGRYSVAIPFAERILALREKALDQDHPDVVAALQNLAELYRRQGRYADAEPLLTSLRFGIYSHLSGPPPHVRLPARAVARYFVSARWPLDDSGKAQDES
jgi:tetratricopeptide (TPR) repeat protein